MRRSNPFFLLPWIASLALAMTAHSAVPCPRCPCATCNLIVGLHPSPVFGGVETSEARSWVAHRERSERFDGWRLLGQPAAPHVFRLAGLSSGWGACQGRLERRETKGDQDTAAENQLSIKGKAYLAGIYEH